MYWIINNPYFPTVIIICVVTASMFAGYVKASAIGPAWPVHALKVYAAPALIVAILGCMYTLSSYGLTNGRNFDCGSDQICRRAVIASENRLEYLRFGLTLLASFATIAIMMWLPIAAKAGAALVPRRDRSVTEWTPDGNQYVNPDPDKWHFDKDSGEFFPISYWEGDRFAFTRETYRDRSMRELSALRSYRLQKRVCWIVWIITGVVLYFVFTVPDFFGTGLFIAGVTGFMAISFSLDAAYKGAFTLYKLKKDVGPRPVPPAGREKVSQQNREGIAVPLSGKRLKDAARGKVNIPPNRSGGGPAPDYSV